MSQNPREFFSQNGFFSLFSMLACIRSGRLDRWAGPFIQASIVPNGVVGTPGGDVSRRKARICDGCRKSGLGRVVGGGVIACMPRHV